MLLLPGIVHACWIPWYSPAEYFMFRLLEPEGSPLEAKAASEEMQNCLSWQALTSPKIDPQDIHRVVYTMPLEEFEAIAENPSEHYDNPFTEWITKRDPAILEFLLLAKTNEYIRFRRHSRWYYPSMKIGARMSLEEVAERALGATEKRLRDRYLLQAVRALYTLGRHRECLDLWEKEISRLPKGNLMLRLIVPYIAGAEFHETGSERVLVEFAEVGDVESILYCSGRAGEELSMVEGLALVCQYAPNSPHVRKELQRVGRSFEQYKYNRDYRLFKDEEHYLTELRKLHELALNLAHDKAIEEPAMWYYTAAFLSDLEGKSLEASTLLKQGEQCSASPGIDESIRLFRIYLDAKTMPYDAAYEKHLLKQLKWLDRLIEERIDDTVREETTKGWKLTISESYYYWNDMMRRILLGEVCPRMLRSGKVVRSLQLANMADNRLLNLVNRRSFESEQSGGERIVTLHQYRYSEAFNEIDYSNHFFMQIDTLGADVAMRYLEAVERPSSEFDRFLNARSYTGRDYLNDLIGTQSLREMRYRDAVRYLGAVSPAYKAHLNVTMDYDPFSIAFRRIGARKEFRYDFACEMLKLEESLALTRDPNRKARLMARMAVGIRNSFDCCGELTQYYRGNGILGIGNEKYDWREDRKSQAARQRVKELIEKACATATDKEVAAEILYSFCNFKRVVERYPESQKAALIRGHCDRLRDYHAESQRLW